jgi:hypothetical protein
VEAVLDSARQKYNCRTWEQKIFRVARIPFMAMGVAVLGLSSCIQGCLMAVLIPVAVIALVSLVLGVLLPAWLALVLLVAAGYLIIGSIASATWFAFLPNLSEFVIRSQVLRVAAFPIVFPINLLFYFVDNSIGAPSPEDRLKRELRLASLETYPLTHLWWREVAAAFDLSSPSQLEL